MRMPPTLGSSADIARTTLRTRAAAGLTRGAATTYGADVPPLPRLAERIVFIVHGVVTIAAAILLAVLPGVIPATVGIAMDRVDDLMAYLLAAAELCIGLLSIGAARLDDVYSVRLIAMSFAAFHGATAALEVVYIAMQGPTTVLLVNLVVRIAVCALFLWIGLAKRTP